MRRTILIILLLGFVTYYFFKPKQHKTFEEFFDIEVTTESNIEDVSISLTKIPLELTNSSYVGELSFSNNRIYFVDFKFGLVYELDTSGNFITKHLGQGNRENEIDIAEILRFSRSTNGNWNFYGNTNDIYIFDSQFNKVSSTHIDWRGTAPYGDSRYLEKFSTSEPIIYSFDFANREVVNYNENDFIPIYSEHKLFNPLNVDLYYKESRIIAEIDLKDPNNVNVKQIYGRRTPELLKYKYLPQHSTVYFDIDKKGNFYLSNEIDSVIYVYDKKYRLKEAFGLSAVNFKYDYKEINSYNIDEYRNLYYLDKPKRSFYKEIKYFEDNNLLFRFYNKFNSEEFDGLQVYRDNSLICDLKIPNDMVIVHEQQSVFYSNLFIDEDLEKAWFYKLKLDIH